jgi:Ner family transcriptional regulator
MHTNATTRAHGDWHPADVLAALKKRGVSLRQLAKACTDTATSTACWSSPWLGAEKIVADALGMKPKDIWPSRYEKPEERMRAFQLTRKVKLVKPRRKPGRGRANDAVAVDPPTGRPAGPAFFPPAPPRTARSLGARSASAPRAAAASSTWPARCRPKRSRRWPRARPARCRRRRQAGRRRDRSPGASPSTRAGAGLRRRWPATACSSNRAAASIRR